MPAPALVMSRMRRGKRMLLPAVPVLKGMGAHVWGMRSVAAPIAAAHAG